MTNVWKVSPGLKAQVWSRCRDHKCISINWLDGIDFSEYTKDNILAALESSKEGKSGSASTIWSFVNEVRKKDIVVANKGLRGIVGIGVVMSDYLPPGHSKNPNRNQAFHRHVRRVEWVIDQEIQFKTSLFNQPTLHRLTLAQVEKIKWEYEKQFPELSSSFRNLFPDSLSGDEAGEDIDDFIPPDEDTRQTVERQIKARRGQKKFREGQLLRFGNACAVTGCEVIDLLEAAHISPYRGDEFNINSNGILLRTDIHTLFDLNLLAIHPSDRRIVLAKQLRQDATYGRFHGQVLNLRPKTVLATNALVAKFNAFLQAESGRGN